jgi:hypothetical protein
MYGLTEKVVELLKLSYQNSRAQVKINNELSDVLIFETVSYKAEPDLQHCLILFLILF